MGIKCGEVFSQQGWRGPLNINCQQDRKGKVKIFEFNGRFTGATHARFLLGYDEIAIALHNFAQISIRPQGTSKSQKVIRYPTGKALQKTSIEELEYYRVWRKQ